MSGSKSILDFMGFILSSFFRWWWAAITGAASLVSLAIVPPDGVLISRIGLFMLVFSISAMLFFILASLYRGWGLYQQTFNELKFIGFQRNSSYGCEYVTLLNSTCNIPQGSIIELKRFDEDIEGPMALVEIMEMNNKGQYQGRPIWISPGHLRDLKLGKLSNSNIIAKSSVQLMTIQRAKDELILRSDIHD